MLVGRRRFAMTSRQRRTPHGWQKPGARHGFARASPARHYAGMIGLTDTQARDCARTLPVEKRDLYLQRIAAMLALRGRGHFGDSDVADVTALALRGLVHTDAA
jgi:hypothetical protein